MQMPSDIVRNLTYALLPLTVTLTTAGCNKSQAAELQGARVFVSNEDSGDLSVLDAVSGQRLGSVAVGKRPRGLRASADGKEIYVALSGSPKGGPGVDETQLPPPNRSADGIGVVDARSLKLVRVLPSGADPEAFDIARGKLFVSNEDSGRTSIIGLDDGKKAQEVAVGQEPEGVTASPDGRTVYVTCEATGEVYVLDASTGKPLAQLRVGERPRAVAFTADGKHAYVTNELSASVSVIDTQPPRVVQTVSIAPDPQSSAVARPMGIVIAPDAEHAYVTTGRGGSVVELRLRDGSISRRLPNIGPRPWGIGITPDGKRLYVANGPSNDVALIDVAGWRIERRIPVGNSPWGITITPAAAR